MGVCMFDIKLEDNTPSARLKYARELTGLSRTLFCKISNLSLSSVSHWENGEQKYSRQAAEQLTKSLKERGIQVSVEWLMEGVGHEPRAFNEQKDNQSTFNVSAVLDEEEFIWRESTAFAKFYKDCLVHIIPDDSSFPLYKPRDHIGGKIIPQEAISLFKADPFIVELEDGSIMLRYLEETSKVGIYHLRSINQATVMTKPLIKNVRIKHAAPVIWFRRRSLG
jgi:transcriptional regulator with XRE-family HTH domain